MAPYVKSEASLGHDGQCLTLAGHGAMWILLELTVEELSQQMAAVLF